MEQVLQRSSHGNISVFIPFYGFLNKLLCDGKTEILYKVCKMSKIDSEQNWSPKFEQILAGSRIQIITTFALEEFLEANPSYPFYVGSERYFGNYFAIAYSKMIPAESKKQIDGLIYSIFESGLYRFWMRENAGKVNSSISYFRIGDDNDFTLIGLCKTKGIFYIFLINCFSSVVMLLFEIIYNRIMKTTKLIKIIKLNG